MRIGASDLAVQMSRCQEPYTPSAWKRPGFT